MNLNESYGWFVGNIEKKLVLGNITLGYLRASTNAFAYDVVAQGLGHHNNLTMGHLVFQPKLATCYIRPRSKCTLDCSGSYGIDYSDSYFRPKLIIHVLKSQDI